MDIAHPTVGFLRKPGRPSQRELPSRRGYDILSRIRHLSLAFAAATALAPPAYAAYRPTDPDPGGAHGDSYDVAEHDPPHCSAHFCVHWVTSTDDAPELADSDSDGVPDTVERTASRFEQVRARENGAPPEGLGWREPKPDGGLGGLVDKTDVYIKNLHGGALGIARGDGGSAADGSGSATGYVLLERTLTRAGEERRLADIAAHEYCHVLQYAYDAFSSGWLQESTATWMQDAAFPQLDLWPRVMPSWAAGTESALTQESPGKEYGAAVWNHWLAGRYGAEIVRNVWERSPKQDRPSQDALLVYDAAIAGHGGRGFFDEFTRFAAALPEWRLPGNGFTDSSLLPDVERVATLTPGDAPVELSLRWDRFALLDVPVGPAHAIKIEANLPEGKRGAIALVGRRGGGDAGSTVTRFLQLPAGGEGSVTLERPAGFERVTAVIVDAHLGAWDGPDTASARVVSLPNGAPTAAFGVAPEPALT
ncbi:MAG: hypothetical protein QOJ57_647, partial [Thermoleophilaceae bacterium]|nr:hypothetical protein [Thermoleophilaceae bacterium]